MAAQELSGFESVIQNYLTGRGEQDPLFAETLKKEKKSIKECCSYIMSEVRKNYKGSAVAVPDDEVFNMAVHYYDEDDIVVDKPVQAKVSAPSSKQVEKTAADKLKEASDRIKNQPAPTPAPKRKLTVITNQPSLF